MDGGRLHGWRRYDYKDVIGRVEPGAETERMSGSAKPTLGVHILEAEPRQEYVQEVQ